MAKSDEDSYCGRCNKNCDLWCTMFLVISIIISHSIVLMGNLETADAFVKMGHSTGGWSDIGLQMSDSMIDEVEYLMTETNHMLVTALNDVVEMQNMMNFVLGATGNSTELAVQMLSNGNSKVKYEIPMSEVDTHLPGLSTLSVSSTKWEPDIANLNEGPIKGAVHGRIAGLVKKLSAMVEKFWKMIRPALVQVGKWLHSMGEKMQGFIEQFSLTLDKAQKIFDQLMSKLAGKSHIKEQMVYDTFNILDCTHKGSISTEDIENVASLYGITALSGDKGKELHKKYDANNDKELSEKEYNLLVEDKSVPGLMPYILRTFGKRLSQIAGKMKGAKKRDEVSETVVEYFQLQIAKNLTKIHWVSQALVNNTLPIEFSADVFKQLVQQDRDPGKLTNLPVGSQILAFMVDLDSKYVGKVVKEMADPVFWHKQGFDPKTQAATIKQVKKWVKEAKATNKADAKNSKEEKKAGTAVKKKSLLSEGEELVVESEDASYLELIADLDLLTEETMHKRMREFQTQQREDRMRKHEEIFHARPTKHLFRALFGDVTLKGAAVDSDIERVTKGGVPAKPETLQFARWLTFNATHTADTFMNNSFDYSKVSSNAVDSFANQVQGFIKKVQQFLSLMLSYTTERGIHELHQLIKKFIKEAETDIKKVVDKLIAKMLLSEGEAPEEMGQISTLQTLSLGTSEELGISGVWSAIEDVLNTMKSILPTVIDDIKYAKNEVSAVAATLKSTFGTFKAKGNEAFDDFASLFKTVWILYYIIFVSFALAILGFAFYAYDFCGGESVDTAQQQQQQPRSYCATCFTCMATNTGCFWTVIVILQIVILVMFVVSVTLCLLAGIKFFIKTGCSQIYVLGDETVCTSILVGIRFWMETFWEKMPSDIHSACNERTLVACKAIENELVASAMKTAGGSFMAAVLSVQLLFQTAKLQMVFTYKKRVDWYSDENNNDKPFQACCTCNN